MTAQDQIADERAATRITELRAAGLVTVSLIVLGAVLGLVWAAWSPARPPGVELPAGTVQINESEAFAAGDGRFAIIAAVVGLSAAIGLWRWKSVRGPAIAAALAVGGLAGAWVMGLVGHLAGHGTNSGPPQTEIVHLPLQLHATGFYALEAFLAVLVYSILVAFAIDDDLGRPDPARSAAAPRSVQPEHFVQDSWAHGDGPGFPQQGQFPPQDPGQGSQPFAG